MKLLVDAQLPKQLAAWLTESGHDTIHTLSLPNANRTSDAEICEIADSEGRTVITKDDDFVYSYLVQGCPRRLLLVSTGNISNADLLGIFQRRLPDLVEAFSDNQFVELRREALLVHE